MDERVKSIRHLRDERAEAQKAADELLAGVGKAALERLCGQAGDAVPEGELEAYQDLNRKIAATVERLARLEEETARLSGLEREALTKGRELSAKNREAEAAYRELGRAFLSGGAAAPEGVPFKDKEAFLRARVGEAEERIERISRERGTGLLGFFAAYAKKARESRDIRQANAGLRRLYADCGAALARAPGGADKADAAWDAALAAAFLRARSLGLSIRTLEEDAARAKREIAAITDGWKKEGSRRDVLQEDIRLMEAERTRLYVKAGARAAAAGGESPYNAVLHTNDLLAVDNAQKERDKVGDIDDKIRRLENSLEADIRLALVEKIEKRIAAKRLHVSKLESDIMEMEDEITRVKKEIIRLGE